jgi:ABC-2 type transport system permease protein
MVRGMSDAVTNRPPGAFLPLLLLGRVNATQTWRRLKAVRDQSRLLTVLIAGFILSYLVLSFWLFYRALRFVGAFPGLGIVLTERLLFLLFAFLFVLLLLSNLIISYTNFFRNREAGYLMSMPIPTQTIFRWKFCESTLLASWAFLFLIAPLMVAFGLTRDVPWHFYPVTFVLIGLFIILPGVAGSWLALNLARYLDRRAFQLAALGAAIVAMAYAAYWWHSERVTDEMLETRVVAVLDQLLQKTRFAQFPFLPSYWLSTSVLQWADGALNLAGFFILVLLSNVLLFGFLAFTRLGTLYYEAASRVQSRASVWGQWEWFRASARREKSFAYRAGWAEKFINLLGWLDADTRALLVKDARMFWRDTTQWGQTVLLFGLLGVYVINVRHFTSQFVSPFWIHLVSYLNLGACSLNLATLTTRFVYPQFSLEGRRLWIIGMAPMGLVRIVKAKYWLASFASLVVTLTLVVLSSCLLHMPWDRVVFFGAVITVMTFSLNGLAAGLGVLYPNFKEANPSKIVSGFGGTFCLVLSFLYILGSVLILAFGAAELSLKAPSQAWAVLSVSVFFALSFLVGWMPFRLGLLQLRNFEF